MKTECETPNPQPDSPISTTPLDQLAQETARLACGALGGRDIRQIWAEPHRILFRLADGRSGSMEVLVNWDVVNDTLYNEPAAPTRLAAPACRR